MRTDEHARQAPWRGLASGLGLVMALALPPIGASLLPATAQAAAIDDAEARAVRAVVEAQIEAMAADDAERAWSYAAPDIQAQFGNAGQFMAMVRQGYPMVIRPRQAAYFRAVALDEAGEPPRVAQLVRLTDARQQAWLAHYQLQRQPDGRWRISGCIVRPDRGEPLI